MSRIPSFAAAVAALLVASCATPVASDAQCPVAPSPEPMTVVVEPATHPDLDAGPIPEYRLRWGGLYARRNGDIVDAPAGDVAVAKAYPHSKVKGPLNAPGERITILTAKDTYQAGEEIRVIHVYEATRPGLTVYVMGPKAIFGESIDGALVTPRDGGPSVYDGAILESPELDYNYEVTAYTLARGVHRVRWTLTWPPDMDLEPDAAGSPYLTSNELVIRVE